MASGHEGNKSKGTCEMSLIDNRFLPMLAVSLWLSIPAPAGGTLELSRDGTSSYVIVTPADSIPAEATAAQELAEHLRLIGGAALKSRQDGGAPTPRMILVGPSDTARKLLPDIDFNRLQPDEVVIRTVGDNLVLAGGRPRGTLYAVYTFLEDVLGCRWWTSTESFIPRRDVVAIGPLDIRHAPQFLSREAYYADVLNNPVFAARLKNNGSAMKRIQESHGGHLNIVGFCHTAEKLLPPEKYFASHPEWYSELGGKRVGKDSQLCFTNRAMWAELAKNALEALGREPRAEFISISQNDNERQCQCAACRAVDEAGGSPAASLLLCVNAVAAEIEKHYPNVLVETLAYGHTTKAPKAILPRPNVMIRLCSSRCDFLRPLNDPANSEFLKAIEEWRRLTPRLLVWDYTANFSQYLLPHPNLQVLGPNLKLFADNQVLGVFEQGDEGCSIGDFVRLRAWLLGHLLWNPRADADALTAEFLAGYYGAAAPFLGLYLRTVQDAALRADVKLGMYHRHSYFLTKEDLARCGLLFDQAELAVKDDPAPLARVVRERAALSAALVDRYFADLKPPVPGFDIDATLNQLDALGRQYRPWLYCEGGVWADYVAKARTAAHCPPAKTPELCRNLPGDQWIDLQCHGFKRFGAAEATKLVVDAAASGGQAYRIASHNDEWLLQDELPPDVKDGLWHCYASLRCDSGGADEAPVARVGIYDGKNRRSVAMRECPGSGVQGATYQIVDLGVHPLSESMFLWLANPSATPVHIDRFFLVKDGARPEGAK